MSVISLSAAKNAKAGGEKYCTKSAISFAAFDKFLNVIKRAWPRKTEAHVAHLTGASERAVQYWLAGKTRMSIDAVVALLKTEAGYDILEAIMDDGCKAEWWLVTKVAQDVRRSRKAIRKEQERIAASAAQLDLIDDLKK